ncbi:MAG: hypothetical protein ACE5NW_04585 [Acidiferrobacterales bacterium]
MLRRYVLAVVFAVAVAAAPAATWACSAAGSNTHVGQLMKVDTTAKSFTIFDVETASPITFLSDEALIQGLKGVQGMVQVLYEEHGDVLRAVDVLY